MKYEFLKETSATTGGGEEGGNSGSEKAVIGLWKSIILPVIQRGRKRVCLKNHRAVEGHDDLRGTAVTFKGIRSTYFFKQNLIISSEISLNFSIYSSTVMTHLYHRIQTAC